MLFVVRVGDMYIILGLESTITRTIRLSSMLHLSGSIETPENWIANDEPLGPNNVRRNQRGQVIEWGMIFRDRATIAP